MKSYKIIIFLVLSLGLLAPAMAERGDMSVAAFGNLTDSSININGGVGFMLTDSLKTSVNLSLIYSDLDSSESTTGTVFLEAQYYFGDFYTANSLLFSVGAGLLLMATDTTSSSSSTSPTYYDSSTVDSTDNYFSVDCSTFPDPASCQASVDATQDAINSAAGSSSSNTDSLSNSSSGSNSSDVNMGFHVFAQANQFFEGYENASVFYRLLAQSVDGGDTTTTFTFGVEIYF